MVGQQENTPHRPDPAPYHSEQVRLAADNGTARAIINERTSRGWKLLSAIKEPGGDILWLEWDTSGSFSK